MKSLRSFAAAAVALAAAGCTTATMMRPAPIAVPPGVTRAQVAYAIRAALLGRGWTITGSGRSAYTAELTGGDWQARIRLPYDTHQVAIDYVSSTGLDHATKDGTETINRHWNNWMVALTQAIRANLAAAAHGP